jgi:hypothetical protein
MSELLSLRRLIIVGLLSFFLVIVAVLNFAKGFNPDVQMWGMFHWWTTYSSGPIKRGLVGSLFQFLAHGSPVDVQLRYVAAQHLVVCLLMIFGLWLMARRMLVSARNSRDVALVASAWLVFFSSQFLPTIGYNTGYLDVHVAALFGLAVLATAARRYGLAAVISAVGPLVHESFLFLWLSAVVLLAFAAILDRRDLIARQAVALVPFATTFVILAMHSQDAAVAQLAATPVDADTRQFLLTVQFGQTAGAAFVRMLGLYRQFPVQVIVSTVYFLLPSMLIGVVALALWRRRHALPLPILAFCAATVAPLASLLFAWDLSRLLVLANYSAIASLAYISFHLERSRCPAH